MRWLNTRCPATTRLLSDIHQFAFVRFVHPVYVLAFAVSVPFPYLTIEVVATNVDRSVLPPPKIGSLQHEMQFTCTCVMFLLGQARVVLSHVSLKLIYVRLFFRTGPSSSQQMSIVPCSHHQRSGAYNTKCSSHVSCVFWVKQEFFYRTCHSS